MLWLDIYRECVKRLEARSYTKVDDGELDADIDARESLERRLDELTNAEKAELAELDERFRNVLIPALKEAGLLNWYQRRAAYYAANNWWWHVEE